MTTQQLKKTREMPRMAETVATLHEQLQATITRALREAAGIVSAPMAETQTMPAVVS